MSRTPAIAASLLLGSLIATGAAATPAHAATAYIAPVSTYGATATASATIALQPEDDCTISWQYLVVGAYPGAPIGALWVGPTPIVNACSRGKWYEDMSIAVRVSGPVVPTRYLLPHRRYLLGVKVCARGITSHRVGCHTTVRSFWGPVR